MNLTSKYILYKDMTKEIKNDIINLLNKNNICETYPDFFNWFNSLCDEIVIILQSNEKIIGISIVSLKKDKINLFILDKEYRGKRLYKILLGNCYSVGLSKYPALTIREKNMCMFKNMLDKDFRIKSCKKRIDEFNNIDFIFNKK